MKRGITNKNKEWVTWKGRKKERNPMTTAYKRIDNDHFSQMLMKGHITWEQNWPLGFSNIPVIGDLEKSLFTGVLKSEGLIEMMWENGKKEIPVYNPTNNIWDPE